MPLLVPSKEFRDEIIHNKILWRTCLKEDLIPPITVYCDYFVKSTTEAPSLGYEIYCIKTPSVKGAICNFHPKHIFILVENSKKEKSLILINGSGNISVGGWCENIEGFSIQTIHQNRNYPYTATQNVLQKTIIQTSKIARIKDLLKAELLVYNFLNYVDLSINHFSSLDESFTNYLERSIFSKDDIEEIEIISPYFSKNYDLITYLKTKGVSNVKCLIPLLWNNEVQLEKQHFQNLADAGLIWSLWKDQNMGEQPRNQHSKIYRFYAKDRTYTVIGSVNFTNPAWKKFTEIENTANIESACLYVSDLNEIKLLTPNANNERFTFCESLELEGGNSTSGMDRNAPDIYFTLDWKSKKLHYENLDKANLYLINLTNRAVLLKKGNSYINLSVDDLNKYTKITLIEVEDKYNGYHYTYYPHQNHIHYKPLDFKLDAITILNYWSFLGDEYKKGAILSDFSDCITDESGIVDDELKPVMRILNEWAIHFSGLIKLEDFLFKKEDRSEATKDILYYLLSENIDTLTFYLTDLHRKRLDGSILNSFYWIILQIVIENFYSKAIKFVSKNWTSTESSKQLISDLKARKKELQDIANRIHSFIPGLEIKKDWVISQLKVDVW